MTIYYFSSTGNCLFVAKQLGEKLKSVARCVQENDYDCEDDAIGLVFPVYGLCVPPFVVDFIEKVNWRTDYLFAIATYGTIAGDTLSQLKNLAEKRGMTFSYLNSLHMQENYLPGFAMEKQKEPASQKEKLAMIQADIAARKRMIKRDSATAHFLSWTHQKNYHYTRGVGMTGQYQILESCTGCGICSKICPTGNIKMINGTPEFGKDCISCLGCIQNCPKTAIHMTSEKSEARYRNPKISVGELFRENCTEEIHTTNNTYKKVSY